MWLLWKEYRKESRLFWVFSSFAFLLIGGFMIYKVGFQHIHIEGIAQIILVLVFFFLLASFVWEMYRQIKSWKKSQYRLLPISEGMFYFSNILFSWFTTTMLSFIYYFGFVGLVFLLDKQVDMFAFQEYWKHLFIASYLFFSASVLFQFVYLLSSLISARVAVKLQSVSKLLLFLLLFTGEVTVSNQLLEGYKKISFIDNHQFKIIIGYVPLYLEDLVFDMLLLILCSIASIFILRNYIEAERG